MSAPSTILDLPLDALRAILSYVPRETLPAVRLSCSLLSSFATEQSRRHVELTGNLKFDAELLPLEPDDGSRDIRVKALYFVPYERRALSVIIVQDESKEGHRCMLEASGGRKYPRARTESHRLMQSLTERGGFHFDQLGEIQFSSPEICDSDPRFVAATIDQFPHITKLTLPFTLRLQKHGPFHSAARSLDSLRYLHVNVSWPHTRTRLGMKPIYDYNRMDLSTLWEVVKANVSTMECLRVNFCQWDIERRISDISGKDWTVCSDTCLLRSPVDYMTEFIFTITNFRPSHTIDFYAPWQRRYFPIYQNEWPEQLKLRVLQFEVFAFSPAIGTLGCFFRPETLEVLSLILCHGFLRVVECKPQDIVATCGPDDTPDYVEELKQYVIRSKAPNSNLQAIALGLPSQDTDNSSTIKVEVAGPHIVAFNRGDETESGKGRRRLELSASEVSLREFRRRGPSSSSSSDTTTAATITRPPTSLPDTTTTAATTAATAATTATTAITTPTTPTTSIAGTAGTGLRTNDSGLGESSPRSLLLRWWGGKRGWAPSQCQPAGQAGTAAEPSPGPEGFKEPVKVELQSLISDAT
ncbi:hypothetical protein Dda_8229 [Drechslerella dactyloides]|uniref:F-box domain-containing protein n=1 Tax=Drechslerella dactyloides TaxID=74499 RepID=A0AAD6ITG5_DREDA|nr:hypothetical protein Dda_8229 [Drechslerella dactyloides]